MYSKLVVFIIAITFCLNVKFTVSEGCYCTSRQFINKYQFASAQNHYQNSFVMPNIFDKDNKIHFKYLNI